MVYLYLICGIIIGCLFTWIFLQRRSPERTMSSDDGGAFRDNVSKLITEFNKVSNANINILEDKIQDIKEAIEMADERIVRINLALSDIGIVSRRIKEKPAREEIASLSEITNIAKNKSRLVDISLPAAFPSNEMILTEGEGEEEAEGRRQKAGDMEAQRHKGTKDEERISMTSVSHPELKILMPLRNMSREEQRNKGTKAQNIQLSEVSPLNSEFSNKKQPKTDEKKKAKPEKKEEKPVLTPLSRTATKEEKKEVIDELLSAGFSVEDISRAVGLSQTEVQLTLGLKKKKGM